MHGGHSQDTYNEASILPDAYDDIEEVEEAQLSGTRSRASPLWLEAMCDSFAKISQRRGTIISETLARAR